MLSLAWGCLQVKCLATSNCFSCKMCQFLRLVRRCGEIQEVCMQALHVFWDHEDGVQRGHTRSSPKM